MTRDNDDDIGQETFSQRRYANIPTLNKQYTFESVVNIILNIAN